MLILLGIVILIISFVIAFVSMIREQQRISQGAHGELVPGSNNAQKEPESISSKRGPRLPAVGEASASSPRSEEREDHGLRPWESIVSAGNISVDVGSDLGRDREKVVHREEKEGRAHVGKKIFKTMSQVEAVWGDFLARMKPVNAHLVAILRATKPTEFDGEKLTLATFYRFHKDKLEEPKILAACEKILEEVLDQKIHLKIALANRWDKPPKAVSGSDVVEVESSDLASIASEIFSK